MNELNMKSKETYVIGDVHGCYYTLQDLIAKLPQDARLIFVGDLCDRGLHSKDVFEFVINNGYESIMGNHEKMFVKYAYTAIKNPILGCFWSMSNIGGVATINSYKDDYALLEKHLTWCKNLPAYLLVDNVFITHGFALPYFESRDDKEIQEMYFSSRYYQWYLETEEEIFDGKIYNIFGHTSIEEPLVTTYFANIDTGACYGDMLSAINIKTKETISVAVNPKDL